VEATPEITGEPVEGVVVGRGTEADTLMDAGIESASGLIAGTDNDANNLSIVVTARELNPDLFFVVRQNHQDNTAIIDAVNADLVMHPSQIIADKIRVLLATPMLYKFISLAYHQDNEWACELTSRITAIISRGGPHLEEIEINEQHASAATEVLKSGQLLSVGDLLRDPWCREDRLDCILLLIKRHDDHLLLPNDATQLKLGDRMLLCSGRGRLMRLYWNLQHDNILSYVRTGEVVKHGWLWNLLSRKD
jgi:Trk K+ transport system NAD-binding subunit